MALPSQQFRSRLLEARLDAAHEAGRAAVLCWAQLRNTQTDAQVDGGRAVGRGYQKQKLAWFGGGRSSGTWKRAMGGMSSRT